MPVYETSHGRVGPRRRRLPKFRLYVKPSPVPKWWPRDAHGVAVWAGVFKDGAGWTLGDGDRLTRSQVMLARQLVEVRGRRFKVAAA